MGDKCPVFISAMKVAGVPDCTYRESWQRKGNTIKQKTGHGGGLGHGGSSEGGSMLKRFIQTPFRPHLEAAEKPGPESDLQLRALPPLGNKTVSSNQCWRWLPGCSLAAHLAKSPSNGKRNCVV